MRIVEAPHEQLPPLDLRRLRDLDLSEPPEEGRAAHIASASGIAKRGNFTYVIGDDLLEVGVFELAGGGPGTARRVFAAAAEAGGEPDKPDLEGLTSLPPGMGIRLTKAALSNGKPDGEGRQRQP
jgi:hypothetical protein